MTLKLSCCNDNISIIIKRWQGPRTFRQGRYAQRWRSFARAPRCSQQREAPSIEKETADNSAKGRWNGGSFTPSMEESPCPHRSSSSAFSLLASPRTSPLFLTKVLWCFPSTTARYLVLQPSLAASLTIPPLASPCRPCFLFSFHPSLHRRSPFKPSPPFSPIPLSSLPFPRCHPRSRLVSLAKKFTFAKKKGKRREKSILSTDWPRPAGPVLALVRSTFLGVA